jgi:hypothetical protein
MLISITLYACESNDKGQLKSEIETLELTYIAWACDCANWASAESMAKHPHNADDSLAIMSLFIEPADSSLVLPDTLGYSGDKIRFTGSFYEYRGFPENYRSIENPDKARVFRYTHYQVLKSNHKEMTKGY